MDLVFRKRMPDVVAAAAAAAVSGYVHKFALQ